MKKFFLNLFSKKTQSPYVVRIANDNDTKFAVEICELIEKSAKERGVGIAKRDPDYITKKMQEGKAIIALKKDDGTLIGFSYTEVWDHEKYVATSGMIVKKEFRGEGISRLIKKQAFNLARNKWPKAKIFSITTNDAVMKLNQELGYKTVSFLQLTQDEDFWKGCQSCPFYDVLQRTQRTKCLCNGMIYTPKK